MLWRERLSVVLVHNPRFTVADIGERQVRRVTAVAISDEITDFRLRIKVNIFEQGVK